MHLTKNLLPQIECQKFSGSTHKSVMKQAPIPEGIQQEYQVLLGALFYCALHHFYLNIMRARNPQLSYILNTIIFTPILTKTKIQKINIIKILTEIRLISALAIILLIFCYDLCSYCFLTMFPSVPISCKLNPACNIVQMGLPPITLRKFICHFHYRSILRFA